MSTQLLQLQNEQWTLVHTGPTTQAISVEPGPNMGTVWLAISDAVPAFTAAGHLLSAGKLKMVELSDGEQLYAYASPLNDSPCTLVITD